MSDRVFKFIFQAKLSSLTLNLNFPCEISVVWKRGDKLAQTKQRKPVIKGVVTFNETIAIQCNMTINPSSKEFQSKKTLLNILIFTEKGTKQAGEVQLDVSKPLNQRKEQKQYEESLSKCPDKNAKIKFVLNTYFKEQIKLDNISQNSYNSVNVVDVAGKINQPDFKKKRVRELQKLAQPDQSQQQQSKSLQKTVMLGKKLKSETDIKENVQDTKIKSLQQQNRKLKQDQKQLKTQQERLIKQFELKSMEASQWRRKSVQYKKQLDHLYKYDKEIDQLDRTKKQLFDDILSCRQRIALIFNAAFEIGGPQLADFLQQASGYIQTNARK